MTEFSIGMFADIRLNFTPQTGAITDFFAMKADRNNATQGPNFIKRFS
jgi:hypothetical protein